MPIKQRKKAVNTLIERYIEDTGERPDGIALNRLGHILAWDYMEGDKRPDKMTLEEYPIMTESQKRYRQTGLNRKKNSIGIIYYEVPLSNAEYIAIDGRDYSLPIRRYR